MQRSLLLWKRRPHAEGPAPYQRANKRRLELERRRAADSLWLTSPVEPTPQQATTLYRALLKMGQKTLVVTDVEYFRSRLRHEFEVTARQTSSRVRGIMYERGQWMLQNELGGLL